MTAMAHLTCAAHTRAELVEIVVRYRDAGIDNILALGGDPPKDLDLPPGELHYAVELVRARSVASATSRVGVAAHPEPHPRSPNRESDRRHTAEKLARRRLRDHAVLLRSPPTTSTSSRACAPSVSTSP